jgi:hypothetical protein
MSNTKRPSIKGRGADIFLADDPPETAQSNSTTAAKPPVKATFYLDEDVCSGLDDLWLKMRRRKKTATKSGIVNAILARGIADKLREIDGNEDQAS